MQKLQQLLLVSKEKVLLLLSWIPFVSGLPETSPKDHAEALSELIIAQIVATMPIWAGAIHVAWPHLELDSLIGGLREMVKNGELFIYAASTLSPVIYIVTRERDIPRTFPNKYWYLGVVVFGAMIAAIVYMLQRVKLQPISDPTLSLSLGFYVTSLLVLYLAFVYNNTYLPDPASTMKREEDEFARRVKEHR